MIIASLPSAFNALAAVVAKQCLVLPIDLANLDAPAVIAGYACSAVLIPIGDFEVRRSGQTAPRSA